MTDQDKDKTLDLLVMRKPQWSNDTEQSSSAWLVSFTDVIALMLTFFVLLYAMSDPVQDKWENKMGITPDAVSEYSGAASQAGMNEGVNINRLSYNQAENIDYVAAVLEEILAEESAGDQVSFRRFEDGLELTLKHSFFNEADEINRRSQQFIRRLAQALGSFDNQITLFYAANTPDSDQQFKRSQTIGLAFKKARYDQPITIAVRGDIADEKGVLKFFIEPHDGRRITR
jgi:chemotaxis protein MotB